MKERQKGREERRNSYRVVSKTRQRRGDIIKGGRAVDKEQKTKTGVE